MNVDRCWVVNGRSDLCVSNNLGETCLVGCLAAAINTGEIEAYHLALVGSEFLGRKEDELFVRCGAKENQGVCGAIVKLKKM